MTSAKRRSFPDLLHAETRTKIRPERDGSRQLTTMAGISSITSRAAPNRRALQCRRARLSVEEAVSEDDGGRLYRAESVDWNGSETKIIAASSRPGTTGTWVSLQDISSPVTCSRTARVDARAGAAQQLPSSVRPAAVDAQRPDPRFVHVQARSRWPSTRSSIRCRGLHRLGALLLPRTHLRPGGRPAHRRRPRSRPHRRGRRDARACPSPST